MKVGNSVRAGNKSARQRAKCLAAAVAAVPMVALPSVATTPVASAAIFDALPPGPARVLTLSFIEGSNDDDMQGVMCQEQRSCVPVPYPYLLRSVGVKDLDLALHDGGAVGPQIVFGYSQGARIVGDWLEEHAGTEGAPSPDELSFVLIGNPGRKHGGAHVEWGQTTPETEYKVLDVSRQYDMASDYPDHFNLLAIANAYAGFTFVHANYEEVDLYDSANYFWTEGNTTYVFVPTKNLPLLEPLRWIGLSDLADSLNGPLKEMIEKAYDRSYLPAQPGLPPVPDPDPEPEPDPEPPAEPDPEPEPEPPAEPESELPTEATFTLSETGPSATGKHVAKLVPDSEALQEEPDGNPDGDVSGEQDDDALDNDDLDADADVDVDADVDQDGDEDAPQSAGSEGDTSQSPSDDNDSSDDSSPDSGE